jgi:hypothetical protein
MKISTYTLNPIYLVLLISLPGYGANNWIEIDPSETRQFSFYYDPSSIAKQGNIATIKTLKNFKGSQNSVDPNKPYTFLSNTSLQEIDCAKNKYRLKEISMWSKEFGGGKLEQIHSYGPSTSWGTWVKTTSIESIVVGKACRGV